MWHHIAKVDNILYHNGKEVEKIYFEGAVIDCVIQDEVNLWLKIKE